MKRKISHIIFPFLLVANLMFGQIVLNYLHNPHSEHTPGVQVQNDKANVHRHGEHCKVCSLDIVLHFTAESTAFETGDNTITVPANYFSAAAEIRRTFSIQDRAPPLVL